jgi:peptidoglycan-associated lipoprotein
MKARCLMIFLIVVAVGGCATSEEKKAAPVEDKTVGTDTSGVTDSSAVEGQALGGERADLLSVRRVHFAFDSSAIDDESRAVIEAHAAHLAANSGIRVRLEGHCDERGTREYNLALGERRAQAVERMMRLLGVNAGNLSNTTYGEEKPIAPEHNESAWRLNRRVEIVY